MFKVNGLMNNKYFLTMITASLLVVAGCSNDNSEDYVRFEELKKNTEEVPCTEDDVKIEETLKKSSPSAEPKITNLPPVIAMIPKQVSKGKKNDLLKADTSQSEIKLLVKNRQFSNEKGALRVSYEDLNLLKVLNMEPVPPDAVDHFPDWLSQLDGKQIRLRGYMYPPHLEKGIKRFTLTRDDKECCFGGLGKIYDLIPVQMKKGKSTYYIFRRPFDVVGTFHIDAEYDDEDKIWYQIYSISDAEVIEK